MRWLPLALTLTSTLTVAAAPAEPNEDAASGIIREADAVTLGDRPSTSYPVDVYVPDGRAPFPVVGLGHGFQNGKENAEGLARELASLGLLVVVPQFPRSNPLMFGLPEPGWNDHSRNARILLAAVDRQVARGLGDASRIGLGGHSAGALSAWLAAAERPAVGALVLLDPVDADGLGLPRAEQISTPTLFAFASPGMCNANTNSTPWFARMRAPRIRLKVVGSTHCDPQEPVNLFCTAGCSLYSYSRARSAVFKRYAASFLRRHLLRSDYSSLESMTRDDLSEGLIAEVEVVRPSPAPTDDEPVARPHDGGSPDAGAPAALHPSTALDGDAGCVTPQAERPPGLRPGATSHGDAGPSVGPWNHGPPPSGGLADDGAYGPGCGCGPGPGPSLLQALALACLAGRLRRARRG